ncbi:MAG: NAD(P)/FAD-dependent oxidoreductase [Chloroflexi bacterium]|nr:NAD(P)/FAD-dependent oxidoreductase [Chloroflexota bacterium]
MSYDAIVIGAGHNGLVTAGYLARAGWKVLVLERRHLVGGACVTEDIFPGYRASTAAYLVSLLQAKVVRDLELLRYGYQVMPKNPAYFAPYPDGRYLFMYGDLRQTCAEIAKFSRRDAERYPEYEAFVERVIQFVEPLLLEAPPNLPPREPADYEALARVGRRLGELSAAELAAYTRMFTGSVKDLLDEWFESEQLKVALSTDGLIGANAGPATPGTAYVLLHHVLGTVGGVRGLWGFVKGGMGAITQALARSAEAYGVEIRTEVEVDRVLVRDGAACGVVLKDGSEYRAQTIVSNADPKRTFLGLVERAELDASFLAQVEAYKCEGASFKVNLALGELPSYAALPGSALGPQHRGTTHLCPTMDYAERAWDDAKYGRWSREPMIELIVPTAYDPDLAPPGKHLVQTFVQYAPYRLRDGGWDDRPTGADTPYGRTNKELFVERVIDTIERFAPNIRSSIEYIHALSPLDLERDYGLTGGHIFHGELSADQLFALRPLAGWARYATPVRNLFLCGSGTHPGGGVTGAPGHNCAHEILRRRTSH